MVQQVPKYVEDAAASRGAPDRAPERPRERMSERTEERRLERPNLGVLSDDGRFAVDLSRIPKGMTLNWKRTKLFGQNDKRNQVVSAQFHWQPVPHKDQPHILGHLELDENAPIEVDGLQLMQRPTYLCDEAEKEQIQATDYVTKNQLESLRLTSREQVGPQHTKIKRTTETPQTVD